MRNVKVTLSPNPPQLKKNVTITLDADISKYCSMYVSYG